MLGREQVRENATVEHLVHDCFGRDGDGYGYGFAFADFVFEDAQGFVEVELTRKSMAPLRMAWRCAEASRMRRGWRRRDVASDERGRGLQCSSSPA